MDVVAVERDGDAVRPAVDGFDDQRLLPGRPLPRRNDLELAARNGFQMFRQFLRGRVQDRLSIVRHHDDMARFSVFRQHDGLAGRQTAQHQRAHQFSHGSPRY